MLKHIWRGLCWSEQYGSHPGTPWIVGLTAMGMIGGGWKGAAIMAGIYGPLYLYGAYERGRD